MLSGLLSLSSLVFASVDIDLDGMSDIWEKRYGMETAAANADPDNDGKTNLEESIAGTNPNLTASLLSISQTTSYSDGVVVQWKSEKGVNYQVEKSLALSGNWNPVGDIRNGNGGVLVSIFNHTVDAKCFYRVRIIESSKYGNIPWDDAVTLFNGLDTDQDGDSDLAEIQAGSAPFDFNSKLPALTIAIGSGKHVEWPSEKGKIYKIQSSVDGNSPWTDEGLPHYGTGATLSAVVIIPEGAVKVLRIVAEDIDSDEDGVNDWEELQVGLDPELPKTNTIGADDLTAVTTLLSGANTVSVRASGAVANITQMDNGGFEIVRQGGIEELSVSYTVTGTAQASADYVSLSGTATIPFGKKSVIIPVVPIAGSTISLSESVIMTLQPGTNYTLGAAQSQQVNVIKEVAIDVTTHGAVGDGVANDTLAIQAAIDALEASTTANTLHFPAGTYRLNSHYSTPHQNGTSTRRSLKLGNQDLAGRDIIVRGEQGAELYSTISPTRCKMLVVMGSFRSLLFRGMKWEKISNPLSQVSSSKEPNGAPGVALVNVDDRTIESVVFDDCEFVNCHRSLTVDTVKFTTNGKLKKMGFYNSMFLNPYGANTINSTVAYGGGQQVFVSSWVEMAEYLDNYFDGAGDNMNETNSPGGRKKDGCHFGSPLKLIFKGNVVKRMSIEAVNQTNDHNKLGITKNTFYIPAADGVSQRDLRVQFDVSTISPGDHINVRTNSQNTILRVVSTDVALRYIWVVNDGYPTNFAPGSSLRWDAPCYLQEVPPTEALIENNVLYRAGKGIVANCHARTVNNLLYRSTIQTYLEYHTPLFPADTGSVIDSNYIWTINPTDTTWTANSMILNGAEARITNNRIFVQRGTHYNGIMIGGSNNVVIGNRVYAAEPIINGYADSNRSVGISLLGAGVGVGVPGADGAIIRHNYTRGFDVGVGPTIPFGVVPHIVSDHTSNDDQLPVDPRGLITE